MLAIADWSEMSCSVKTELFLACICIDF